MYPLDNKNSVKYDPSCPVIPVIKAVLVIVVVVYVVVKEGGVCRIEWRVYWMIFLLVDEDDLKIMVTSEQ